jgi:hypothetical protein
MFPQSLEEKLGRMLDSLDRFMIGTEFVFKIGDVDRAEAVRPDLDDSGWEKLETVR